MVAKEKREREREREGGKVKGEGVAFLSQFLRFNVCHKEREKRQDKE